MSILTLFQTVFEGSRPKHPLCLGRTLFFGNTGRGLNIQNTMFESRHFFLPETRPVQTSGRRKPVRGHPAEGPGKCISAARMFGWRNSRGGKNGDPYKHSPVVDPYKHPESRFCCPRSVNVWVASGGAARAKKSRAPRSSRRAHQITSDARSHASSSDRLHRDWAAFDALVHEAQHRCYCGDTSVGNDRAASTDGGVAP